MYQIAAYYRISKEDEEKMIQSNSILNQRYMVKNYIDVHFSAYELEEFVDDGYTGTNLNRPALKNLLDKVLNKEIDIIIVKDLSRFSRNYKEAGYYLDVFMEKNIRFISMNDNYDSADNQMKDFVSLGFKTIINDYYSKEISKKARQGVMQQIRLGRRLTAKPPYGYWKDKKNKKYMIDSSSAVIVKEIYNLYLSGISMRNITRLLNQRNIDSPNMRLLKSNMYHTKDEAKLLWTAHSVRQILCSEVYIGTMVGHKGERKKIGLNYSTAVKEEEWIKVTGTHEAIIEKERYDEVQEMLREKNKGVRKRSQREYFLKGRVYCGECNAKLRNISSKSKYVYYICERCDLNGHSVSISTNMLRMKLEDEIEKLGLANGNIEKVKGSEVSNKEMQQNNKKIEEFNTLLSKEYIDMIHNKISREQFLIKKKEIDSVIQTLKSESERRELDDNEMGYDDLIDKYLCKVIVYEPKKVDILWNIV